MTKRKESRKDEEDCDLANKDVCTTVETSACGDRECKIECKCVHDVK